MKKKKNTSYLFIIVSIIIIGLLCYFLFYNKKEAVSFTFNDSNIQLKLNGKGKINYALSNLDLKIEWLSSNNNVTVDDEGVITANSYGNSIITGKINDGEQIITRSCLVTVYSGDIGVKLDKIDVPEGYILMKPNSEIEFPFTIVPANAYITSIDYFVSDENVAIIENNKIKSRNPGTAYIKVSYNNTSIEMDIKVANDAKENGVVKEISSVSLNEKNITMEMGDVKNLLYEVNPQNGYINDISWSSSNSDIVSVVNGEIKANNMGEAVISITINNNIQDSVVVKVKSSNANIEIDYNPKTVIRIGEKTTIKTHLEPLNVNDTIVYKSSNSSVATVDNGIIEGKGEGTATITLSISNGKTKTFTIHVLPANGSINGTGYLWGYKSLNAKTPVLASESFYAALAQNGIGIMQGNNYIITSDGNTFTYNISGSLLSVNKKRIKVKIFYPRGVNLSITNTLVYMGGRGETDFAGIFERIEKDLSLVKSAGILALIAEGKNASFDGESGAYVTKFIKAITKQEKNVKNSILGFSDGAHKVLHAARTENYDKIIIFSGYTDGASSVENAKDKEIIFIIAGSDPNYSQMRTAMNNMKTSGYKNVTTITTGKDLSSFKDKFLIINPGNLMRNGHISENVLLSGIIEYAND